MIAATSLVTTVRDETSDSTTFSATSEVATQKVTTLFVASTDVSTTQQQTPSTLPFLPSDDESKQTLGNTTIQDDGLGHLWCDLFKHEVKVLEKGFIDGNVTKLA